MKKSILLFALSISLGQAFSQSVDKPYDPSELPQMVGGKGMRYNGNARALFSTFLPVDDINELRLLSSERDDIGFVHDRYAQYYRNTRVEGGEYLMHHRNGVVSSFNGLFRQIPSTLEVLPVLSADRALAAAVQHVGARIYAWDPKVKKGYPDYEKPQGVLVIWDGPRPGKTGPRLAWKFDIYAQDPLYRAYVFIDAREGIILDEQRLIHEANTPSSGATLFNGTQSFTADLTSGVYRLRASSANGGIETYTLKNGTDYAAATDVTSSTSLFSTDSVANQAHWGTEKTLTYFKTMHNRASYNNLGATLKSYVHYSTKYVNAFWDGSRMTYGDGDGTSYKALVSLDIVGHEIAHGVTQFSANLVYQNESGALNESFSDIFGESIEQYAKGSNDWLMGCDIGVNGCGAFRSMKNPNTYGDPDTYGGTNWYTGTGDNGGVHINSGVQNKWFHILTVGESGTNDLGLTYTVPAIGLQKAAAIAYRNLAYYLTSSSAYGNARAGSIQAATDLYGAGSPEVVATTNAWYAVGVGCAYGQLCYCASKGNSQADEWIAGVTIGSFSNPSAKSAYTYFASTPATLTPGASHALTLTPGYTATAYAEYWRIWIDYNKDADFDDAGELVFDAGSAATGARTGSILVPLTASGQTRMRVSMKYNAASTPCEAFAYGEVEDYLVNFGAAPPADTQAPTAPTLSSPSKTTNSIALSWTASFDSVGVVGYDVYVNNVKHNATNITAITYNITGLSANTAYTLFVRARDAAGNTGQSNTLTATTNPDTQAPSAPTLSSPSKTSNSIALSWTASTDNVGVAGYDVYVNNVKHNTTNITGTTYSVTGLSLNTAYTLYVRARDAAGNTGQSNTLTVTTNADTQAPSAPTLSSPAKTTNSIALSWTASTDNVGVAGYDVYVNNVKHNTTNITGTTYSVTGLSLNTAYTLFVRARDAAGNTGQSNTLTVTTIGDTQAPSAPTLSSPSKTVNSIALSWTASTDNVGVAGYDVYVNNVKHNTTNITGTLYSVTGLTLNTAYTLYVRARDAAGNTGQSNTLTVTTIGDAQAPSAPTLSSPSKTVTSIALSWTASTDNVGVAGYDVYVNNVKRNTTNITGTTYGVTGLSANTAYTLYVRARDAAGNTGQSNTLTVTTSADTQAPTAPTLSSPSKSVTSITLSWTASTDNVGVAGYDVYVNNIKRNSSNITGTTASVTGLSANTTYTLYVRARDAAGNTAQSNMLTVTTTADTQAPSAPTLSTPSKTVKSIALSWTASTDNVGVAGYDVYVNNVKHNATSLTGTNYSVTGLSASTTYTLYVRVRDAAGNTAQSNTRTVTTNADIQAPSAPTLSSPSKTVNSIALTWTTSTDNVGVAGYDVFVNNVKRNTTNITGTTFSVTGLSANTTYTVYVRARDAVGNTAQSNTLSVKTALAFGFNGWAEETPAERQQPSLSVFPNPVHDRLNISGVTGVRQVRIYTVSGALVASAEKQLSLDVSFLPKGVYLVEIEMSEGSIRRRIVKD